MVLGEIIEEKMAPLRNLYCTERNLCGLVEETLLGSDYVGDFYVSSENLPFFVYHNLKIIQSRILKNGFKLKIATFNKPSLPGFLKITEGFYNLQDSVEIYKLNEDPKNTSALFYDKNFVFSKDGKRFNLVSHRKDKHLEKYKNDFEKAEKELIKINPMDCFH